MQQKQNIIYFRNEEKMQGGTIEWCCFGSLVQTDRERETVADRQTFRQVDYVRAHFAGTNE